MTAPEAEDMLRNRGIIQWHPQQLGSKNPAFSVVTPFRSFPVAKQSRHVLESHEMKLKQYMVKPYKKSHSSKA